jgi:hypothetical protein
MSDYVKPPYKLDNMAAGWMKFHGNAKVSFTFEAMVGQDSTEQDFRRWGALFGEVLAQYFALN